VKLEYLDEENRQRRRIAAHYTDHIRNPKLVLPELVAGDSHVWHLFVVRTEHRDELQRHLASRGIETLIHYPTPPHRQPAYREWNARRYPVTEGIHQSVLSLPLDISMTSEQIAAVVEACNDY
jgi:dTDP-4-amino-4,6-dideoxygalactose transaminase